MPESAHPLPPEKGWASLPFVDIDGQAWPLDFAEKVLGVPEEVFRCLIKYYGVEPSGVIRMSAYRRQGRQPRAYESSVLILITEALADLADKLKPAS